MFPTQVANEVETMDILKFKPDRLGHGTCIHPSSNGTEELYQTLLDSRIPVGKLYFLHERYSFIHKVLIKAIIFRTMLNIKYQVQNNPDLRFSSLQIFV